MVGLWYRLGIGFAFALAGPGFAVLAGSLCLEDCEVVLGGEEVGAGLADGNGEGGGHGGGVGV